jgi:SAM-dependent methyltransferase
VSDIAVTPTAVYTRQFYERIDPGSRQSAEHVVPRVLEKVLPQSVIDVGCGTGTWLEQFARAGVTDVVGVDGEWVPQELLRIPPDRFIVRDLERPLCINRQFDLVVSLEVAEHLPASSAERFVADLTGLGPVILFSAAVPGQGGDGHINERPHEWWEALFARHGFRCYREFGAQFVSDPCVAWWYSRNMVFYFKEGTVFPTEGAGRRPQPGQLRVRLDNIQPVVMTCAASMPYVEEFVKSYRTQISDALPRPVVVVDLTASSRLPGEYLALISQLRPKAVHVHPRPPEMSRSESINDAAFFVLACGLAEMHEREHLLFVEDDIVFSSQILTHLAQLDLPDKLGLLSLYSPGGGYGCEVIEPYRYYGTQCVLFPREVLQPILDNRMEMERRFSPNYDMRWAQFLGSRGYRICASPKSYVQHIGVQSRLGGNFHSSGTFVP